MNDFGSLAVNYTLQYGIFFSFLLLFCCVSASFVCCLGFFTKQKPKNCIFEVIPYETLYENDENNLKTSVGKMNHGDLSFMIDKNHRMIDEQKHSDSDHNEQKQDDKLVNLLEIVVPDDANQCINLDQNQNKIHLCYLFDNVNDDSQSQVFDDLTAFVNVVIKTMNPSVVEIILKIHSPGGSADDFQNAYLQLKRLRDKKFIITALVDNMCASGGYMLAAACNNIICSEFAEIGSIGVAATLHNYHSLSQKLGIIEKTITTGLYKRPFLPGEPMEQDQVDRVGESVNESLDIFKNIVQKSRNFSEEQMSHILSAKTWNGKQALVLGLVDKIQCSDDYLNQLYDANDQIYFINRIVIESKSNVNDLISLLSKKIFTKVANMLAKSILRSINQFLRDKTKKNMKHDI
jgi:signal peptide peptidase SppA